MKTYIIKLSRFFLKGHPRSGEPTYFVEKFLKGQGMYRAEIDEEFGRLLFSKIHTIRGNYSYWEKRIREVQEGKAILRVQYWSGIPFRSKATTICELTAANGVGIQMVEFKNPFSNIDRVCKLENLTVDGVPVSPLTVCENDGFFHNDFVSWFKGYDLSEPMALIHFTKYRY